MRIANNLERQTHHQVRTDSVAALWRARFPDTGGPDLATIATHRSARSRAPCRGPWAGM